MLRRLDEVHHDLRHEDEAAARHPEERLTQRIEELEHNDSLIRHQLVNALRILEQELPLVLGHAREGEGKAGIPPAKSGMPLRRLAPPGPLLGPVVMRPSVPAYLPGLEYIQEVMTEVCRLTAREDNNARARAKNEGSWNEWPRDGPRTGWPVRIGRRMASIEEELCFVRETLMTIADGLAGLLPVRATPPGPSSSSSSQAQGPPGGMPPPPPGPIPRSPPGRPPWMSNQERGDFE